MTKTNNDESNVLDLIFDYLEDFRSRNKAMPYALMVSRRIWTKVHRLEMEYRQAGFNKDSKKVYKKYKCGLTLPDIIMRWDATYYCYGLPLIVAHDTDVEILGGELGSISGGIDGIVPLISEKLIGG